MSLIKNSNWCSVFFSPKNTHPLFKGLSSIHLETLLHHAVPHHYKASQHIFAQGDTPTHIYLIAEGALRTFRTNEDGDEATTGLLTTFESCMETTLFMDMPSPISVQAINQTKLILIPKEIIQALILKDGGIFAKNFLKAISLRHKEALHQIDAMAIKSPVQRIAYYFLELRLRTEEQGTQFTLPFKKSLIANYLGITPETFSRSLTKIKKEINLDIERENITLHHLHALCRFCDLESAASCTNDKKSECRECPLRDHDRLLSA